MGDVNVQAACVFRPLHHTSYYLCYATVVSATVL